MAICEELQQAAECFVFLNYAQKQPELGWWEK